MVAAPAVEGEDVEMLALSADLMAFSKCVYGVGRLNKSPHTVHAFADRSKFLDLIERSRRRHDMEGDVSCGEMRRRLGLII